MHRKEHLVHYLLHSDINEIYMSMAFRSFAFSLINLFIPLLFIELGFSVASVFLFYGLVHLLNVSFVLFAAKLAARYGFKHIIFFSTPLLILFYICIHLLTIASWLIVPMIVILAFQRALFWVGFNLSFSSASKKGHRGRDIGLLNGILSVIKIVAPVVGGYLLSTYDTTITLFIVSVLLLFSIMPLFFHKDKHAPYDISFSSIFSGRKLKLFFVLVGVGIEEGAALILWPLIIYFMITTEFALIGAFSSVALLVSLLSIFVISHLSDKISKKKMIRFGALLNSIVWLFRGLIVTPFGVFVTDSIGAVTRRIIYVPFNALCYDIANNEKSVAYFILFREIGINAGCALLFISCAIIWKTMGGIVSGMLGSLILLFI